MSSYERAGQGRAQGAHGRMGARAHGCVGAQCAMGDGWCSKAPNGPCLHNLSVQGLSRAAAAADRCSRCWAPEVIKNNSRSMKTRAGQAWRAAGCTAAKGRPGRPCLLQWCARQGRPSCCLCPRRHPPRRPVAPPAAPLPEPQSPSQPAAGRRCLAHTQVRLGHNTQGRTPCAARMHAPQIGLG